MMDKEENSMDRRGLLGVDLTALVDRLADIERPRDQGVKWVPQQNLHVTLRFLGDADVDDVVAFIHAQGVAD